MNPSVSETGRFGTPNAVCQSATPEWRHPVERLKERVPDDGE